MLLRAILDAEPELIAKGRNDFIRSEEKLKPRTCVSDSDDSTAG